MPIYESYTLYVAGRTTDVSRAVPNYESYTLHRAHPCSSTCHHLWCTTFTYGAPPGTYSTPSVVSYAVPPAVAPAVTYMGEAASVAPASATTYGAAPAMTYLAPPAVTYEGSFSCCTRCNLHGRGINAAQGFDVISASPYLRAIQTAQPLADSCELSICIEDGLAEVHHVIGSIPTPVQ